MISAAAGALLLLAGVGLLRLNWLHRGRQGRHALLGGWLLIAAGLAVFGHAWGGEVGAAYGLLALSAAAYVTVGMGVELRPAKAGAARSLAPEPEERKTNWARAIVKSFLAIVFAGIAAIGIGVAFAIAVPLQTQDRIVIGGILVPILWGAGMAWTLSDAKLLRATVLLAAVSLVAYAIAFLPKVLPA